MKGLGTSGAVAAGNKIAPNTTDVHSVAGTFDGNPKNPNEFTTLSIKKVKIAPMTTNMLITSTRCQSVYSHLGIYGNYLMQ